MMGLVVGLERVWLSMGNNIWNEIGAAKASEVVDGDLYGHSISISGNHLVVGAPNQNSAGQGSGAAYVFNIPKIIDSLQ